MKVDTDIITHEGRYRHYHSVMKVDTDILEGGVQNSQSICYTTLIKQFNKQLFHEWLTRDL